VVVQLASCGEVLRAFVCVAMIFDVLPVNIFAVLFVVVNVPDLVTAPLNWTSVWEVCAPED